MVAKKTRKLVTVSLVSGLLVFLSHAAWAEDFFPSGMYVMGGGGYSYLDSRGLNLTPTSEGANLKSDTFSGGNASGTFGVGFKFGQWLPFRIEANYTRRGNVHYNYDPVIANEPIAESLKSSVEDQSGMASLYYDFYFANDYFMPYLGAGAGYARNSVDMDVTPSGGGTTQRVSYTLSGFAWQVGLGARIKLTNNLFFDLGARHASLGKLQWGPWTSTVSQIPVRWKIASDELTADEAFLSIELFFGDQTPHRAPALINDDVM